MSQQGPTDHADQQQCGRQPDEATLNDAVFA
jgi:hypothetical protein